MWMRSVYIPCIVIVIITYAQCTKRHISCTVHPGYNDSSAEVTLNIIYVKAAGSEDTVHYLWSSYKLPSVIVARTTTDTELQIDVNKTISFQKGAIKFSKKPIAVIGLTISELWEKFYNSDKASITDVDSEISLGLEFFEWSLINNETFSCSDVFASAKLNSTSTDESFSRNGRFEIEFSAKGDEGSAQDSPHLIFTGNSTQVRVAFNDLYSNSSRTRYGLEMIVFSSMHHNCSNRECKAVSVDSVSDEFSPGIFTDVDILPPCYEKDDEKDSFLTWRPVAYTSQDISVANSSDAQLTSNCLQYSISNVRSIAELYFIEQGQISENVFNMTFGTGGGGNFYPKTEYTSWTFMVGTGSSVHPNLSLAVIVFISVGLGTLLLFLLIGGVYLIVRRYSKKNSYLSFNNSVVN